MRTLVRTAFLLVLVSLLATAASAQDFNVDFGGAFGSPASTFGGAAEQPGFWNDLDAIRTFDLLDLGGGATAASLMVAANTAQGEGTSGSDSDAAKLLDDHFHDCVDPDEWSLAFSGLQDGLYDVYLYAPSNSAVGTGDMVVGGATVAEIPGAPAPLDQGENWVRVPATVTGGTLEIRGDGGAFNCVGLAGVQLDHLDATPPPDTCEVEACVEDDFTMCLNAGRFRVTAEFDPANDGDEVLDPAHMVRLTDDSGYLWFFRDTNVEAIVKVINACNPAFNRFWVFAGGLTNVRTVIHVCDTAEGVENTYVNPQTTPFQPIQDTDAFDTCD